MRVCRGVCTLAGSYGGRSTHKDDISPLLHRQSGWIYGGWKNCRWRRREQLGGGSWEKPKVQACPPIVGAVESWLQKIHPPLSLAHIRLSYHSYRPSSFPSIFFVFHPQFMTSLLVVAVTHVPECDDLPCCISPRPPLDLISSAAFNIPAKWSANVQSVLYGIFKSTAGPPE